MLRLWTLPLAAQLERVRAEHLHAAISRLMDPDQGSHRAGEKPYALRPPAARDGVVSVDLCTLSDSAAERLTQAASANRVLKLGSQPVPHGGLRPLGEATWSRLMPQSADRAWTIQLHTPTTSRRGSRSTPLTDITTMLGGLARRWTAWSDTPLPTLDLRSAPVFITDLEVRSVPVDWQRRNEHYTLSGCVGWMRAEADDAGTAATVEALLRFGEWAGVGAYTARGLGVMSLAQTRQPQRRRTVRTPGHRVPEPSVGASASLAQR